MEMLDIVIVGAGWHGLAMAKTYLEVCPGAKLTVIDSAASVGGTWAKERLYPGLKTNNIVGSYEFSDFPMSVERFGVQPGNHIPGTVVHEYLSQFVEHFSLTARLQLETKVDSAELRQDSTWRIDISSSKPEQSQNTIIAKKLVLATGLTSTPFVPQFPEQDTFQRQFFHAKELRQRASSLEKTQSIVVLGGNKSAWDTCFYAANQGAHVHMVMRPEGGGPSWVWPVFISPFRLSVQLLATTRLFTCFDPCVWSNQAGIGSWARSFLHRTFIGRKIVSAFWNLLRGYASSAFRYDDHPETAKLKPWVSPYWMGNSLSIHNYTSSWFDLVREGKITVHIADIDHLSEGTVHLSTGEALQVDAFVCCTGWKTIPPLKFTSEIPDPDLPSKLGIASPTPTSHPTHKTHLAKAQTTIFTSSPALQNPPIRTLPPPSSTTTTDPKPPSTHTTSNPNPSQTSNKYHLYRFLIPSHPTFLQHKNIAFIGSHLALTATTVAQAQALWVTAYFTDSIVNLHLPDLPTGVSQVLDRVDYETTLHNEYERIRHPSCAGGSGARCPDLAFDCLSYVDLLLGDLGVEVYRKRARGVGWVGVLKGWWREVMERYTPKDYVGLVGEWVALDRQRKDGDIKAGS